MSEPSVVYSRTLDRVVVYADGRLRLTRDEAQRLAEALTDAVDDAERVDGVGG